MAPFPVKHAGKWWPTSEHLFQALRFDEQSIREEIRKLASPMGAKTRAKKHKAKWVVTPRSERDLENMEMILHACVAGAAKILVLSMPCRSPKLK